MADPFARVHSGEPVQFSAPVWNAMLEAARAEQLRKLNKESLAPDVFRQGAIVRVKNESGRALSRFDILGLDRPIFLPSDSLDSFQREVTFRGTIPTSTHRGKFCVLIDPLDVGRIGRAYVDGVCQVKVNIRNPRDGCADVVQGDTGKLTSLANGGSAEILWREGGEGEQWAVVRLGTNCRVCCSSSSSSSSSTSHECPTPECPEGCGLLRVSCSASIVVQGLHSGDLLTCDSLDVTYFPEHVSGCTWYAPNGIAGDSSPTTGTATLTYTPGSGWTVEIVGYGHTAIFTSPTIDCQGETVLTIDSTDCPVFDGATARVDLA